MLNEITSRLWTAPNGKQMQLAEVRYDETANGNKLMIAMFCDSIKGPVRCLEFYSIMSDRYVQGNTNYVLLYRDWLPPDRPWRESEVVFLETISRNDHVIIEVTRRFPELRSGTGLLYYLTWNPKWDSQIQYGRESVVVVPPNGKAGPPESR